VLNLAGRLTLRQTAALLGRCAIFVGNDSGPMHLAVTQGTAVIEVSCHPVDGPVDHANSPARFGPWQVESRVVRPAHHRAPCHSGCRVRWPHCILGVAVGDVERAVGELWRSPP
jgi:heptosyltransferase-2